MIFCNREINNVPWFPWNLISNSMMRIGILFFSLKERLCHLWWNDLKIGVAFLMCKVPWWHSHLNYSTGTPYTKDYYYHKTDGYNIVAQAIIDCNKFFTCVFVGLLKNVNHSNVLHKYAIYRKVQYLGLFWKWYKLSWVFSLSFGW